MRDYGKVSPQFWTGETGKKILAAGPEAALVALYLMTSPHANMIGLYYMPLAYLAHDTRLPLEGASKGLRSCIEAGFCDYDEASECVFVYEMARYQIAPSLKRDDNRRKGVENELERVPSALLRKRFLAAYGDSYCLTTPRETEAPSKPLRSQEQEQEQKRARESAYADLSPATALPPPEDAEDDDGEQPRPPKGEQGRPPCPHERIIALYHEVLPELRQIREWNETRRRLLQRRWSENPERQNLDWWRQFFGYVRESKFLMGKTTGRDGRPFDCDLEWLIRPTNFAKVIEGKYEDQAT